MNVKGDAAHGGIACNVHHLLENVFGGLFPNICYSFPKRQARRFRNINLNILYNANLSVEVLS
jgi:hypothetical protein